MQKQSQVFNSPNNFRKTLLQRLTIASSVVLSLGLMSLTPPTGNRFQFQQQVGSHVLSGVFEGSDQNLDGVVELSELDSFKATWGDYAWTKEDLEAFVWGEKTISENQNKSLGINGLNLFARGNQRLTSYALQVWNRAVTTPEGQTENQGIYGLEYGAHSADHTLFSESQLKIEVTPVSEGMSGSMLMLLLLLGVPSLLALNPCFLKVNAVDSEPCSSPGKI